VANPEHVERLKRGPEAWNKWRRDNPRVRPDLSRPRPTQFEAGVETLAEAVVTMVMRDRAPVNDAGLSGLQLSGVNLRNARLENCDFARSVLIEADLSHAELRGANLAGCVLTHSNLSAANLQNANLTGAMLRWAKLADADLREAILHMADLGGVDAQRTRFDQADLSYCNIVQANLRRANLNGAHVYGISAWNVVLDGARQRSLSITRTNEPLITVDDLQVAQFIYMILNNRNVRTVIDTLTTKIVLLLGRFTPERKRVLEALRKHLRARDYLPILFDFDRPASRDFTETVVTLAHLARFIIADITDPASVPKELEAIVPRLAIPIQPLLQEPAEPYSMFSDYWKYSWVLSIYRYRTVSALLASFDEKIVGPVERKARQLAARRARSQSRT
jgi:uncharacterized protein YjbI with pentapeptide repeats